MSHDFEQSRRINRARWDELAAIHPRSPFYGVDAFLAGDFGLDAIVDAELGPVDGLRLVHLQCHFGLDTLCLARRGAIVTGLDFSPVAIAEARKLAAQSGTPATFVESDLYDAPRHLAANGFDRAFVTWGAINWLDDIRAWARVVATVLAPGGRLYLCEGHPVMLALEQVDADGPILPTYDYFQGGAPIVTYGATSYSEDDVAVANTEMHDWIHPIGAVVTALIEAGLSLDWLHEHDRLPWRAFPAMVACGDGFFRLPDGASSLPLAYSLSATKRA